MFDYLRNEYNADPRLVLDEGPERPGHVRRLVPWSTSIVVDLPDDQAQLRRMQDGKYWHELRRRERRFTADVGPLTFSRVTDDETLVRRLPDVRGLFAERWRDEYTSLPWKHERGFSPYAAALRELAALGRGELVLLDGPDRLLAFAYCLVDPPWYFFYQHAATPAAELRPFGVGKLLLAKLLVELVDEGRVRHVDLMLGDAAYKREWESWRRPVHVLLEEPDTAVGRLRLEVRTAGSRARHYVQFENAHARRAAKRVLVERDRLRRRRAGARPRPVLGAS